ncbi:hypothetical protein HPP92_019634 [Vanilla planifolia]|uniref:Uncharacterized protein n=1 Tax=Vanilla planifolia TaxID=51239 RepID=A0A835PZW1_VANPL|nr:hypothetical protein HPP92_019634 [Vanilla planifolia]
MSCCNDVLAKRWLQENFSFDGRGLKRRGVCVGKLKAKKLMHLKLFRKILNWNSRRANKGRRRDAIERDAGNLPVEPCFCPRIALRRRLLNLKPFVEEENLQRQV